MTIELRSSLIRRILFLLLTGSGLTLVFFVALLNRSSLPPRPGLFLLGTVGNQLRTEPAINGSDVDGRQSPLDMCRGRPLAVAFVHTAPDHVVHRQVIRNTWGGAELAKQTDIATVFMVGRSRNPAVEDLLSLESSRYGDIIRMDFVDSYRNLSLKVVGAFRWVLDTCPGASFVVKVDDDIFVNVIGLGNMLRRMREKGEPGRRLVCLAWNRMPILRDKKSKWYVSEEELPGTLYPPYCSGSAYIIPGPLVRELYNASFDIPVFWVDDVYATGLLTKKAGIGFLDISSLYSFKDADHALLLEGKKMFGHLSGEAGVDRRMLMWQDLLQRQLMLQTQLSTAPPVTERAPITEMSRPS